VGLIGRQERARPDTPEREDAILQWVVGGSGKEDVMTPLYGISGPRYKAIFSAFSASGPFRFSDICSRRFLLHGDSTPRKRNNVG
jgi:hypothetical protein